MASSEQNPPWSPIPALVIHGVRDQIRGGGSMGAADIAQHVQSNMCSNTTQPIDAGSCASLDGGVAVTPGCVEYQDCAARTVFCHHDDPNYSGTNHGWPCFANQQIFESIR